MSVVDPRNTVDLAGRVIQGTVDDVRRDAESGHPSSGSSAEIVKRKRLHFDTTEIVHCRRELLSRSSETTNRSLPRCGEQRPGGARRRQTAEDFGRFRGEVDQVRLIVLRPLSRQRPQCSYEVEFGPGSLGHLVAPLRGEEKQLEQWVERPADFVAC